MQANETLSASTQMSFKEFLFKDKRNRITLMIALGLMIIQFSIFKYLYPFASYIHGDSFVYLRTAQDNLDINTYMVGYSRFLRLFSVFSSSDTVLVAFQYLLILGSALFFLFTLFHFYKPGKVMQAMLLCFVIINPLPLHLANLISSDGLFLALSFAWFSLLLWLIHRPTIQIIIWHTLILFVAFTVRYNALIYPFIALVAFRLSKISLLQKVAGIGTYILLCGLFIMYTGNKYKLLTGTWQYSPFSGWQLANNAMYAYRYVDSADRKPVPQQFQALDNMIRIYYDTTRNVKKYWVEDMQASTFYMWDLKLPLMKYRDLQFKGDSTVSNLKKWASMGPLYADYGTHIIKQYPSQFVRHFLWPNTKKYYAPPVEFLGYYNSQKDSVFKIAKTWFGYKSTKVTTRLNGSIVYILDYYPVLTGTMNVVFLTSIICFILLNGFKNNTAFRQCMILAITVWLLNAGFTIFSSSAALRFQAFPVFVVTIFSMLLIDWMVKLMKVKEEENNPLYKYRSNANDPFITNPLAQ